MRKLHPATIIVAILPRLREAIQAALPIFIGTFASGHGGNQDWIAIFIGAFTGIFAIGTYWTTRFDIEGDHVVHRTGWIFRKDRRIPLVQIQNVNLRQNVLERLLKVATVDVETAMGRGRDLKLSVLKLADAERLRDELLAAAHLEAGTGANPDPLVPGQVPSPPKIDLPIVQLNNHDLLLGAITENHLGQTMVAILTLGPPALGAIIRYAASLPSETSTVVVTAAACLMPLLAWSWGAIAYYLKFGGFVVRRNENVFRITYGLLNKVQMAIRPDRIEYLHVTTTIPQRLMGRASLSVGTASSFGEAGVFAPVALFVEKHRAYQGASEVIAGLDIANLRWQPFHPYFYRSGIARRIIVVALISLLVRWLGGNMSGTTAIFFWMFVILISTIAICQIFGLLLARPENGFAITEDALVVRRGYFHQAVSAMPIERMENVAIVQPWWWKRGQAVVLAAQAMKHRIHVGALPVSAAEDLMVQWNAKMAIRENQRIREIFAETSDVGAESADTAVAAIEGQAEHLAEEVSSSGPGMVEMRETARDA